MPIAAVLIIAALLALASYSPVAGLGTTVFVLLVAFVVVGQREEKKDLAAKQEQAAAEKIRRDKAREDRNDQILRVARSVIEKHRAELTTRRRQLTVQKPYGLVDEGKWRSEVHSFEQSVLVPAFRGMESELLLDGLWDLDKVVRNQISVMIEDVTARWMSDVPAFSADMNPREYEHLVAGELRRLGWAARVTRGSGDQGIDVVAEKDGRVLAVQCKRYAANVGNKAVQEAATGRGYYGASHAAVVTNSDFTASARQLAASAQVFLLHHLQLERLDGLVFPKAQVGEHRKTPTPLKTSSGLTVQVGKLPPPVSRLKPLTSVAPKESGTIAESNPSVAGGLRLSGRLKPPGNVNGPDSVAPKESGAPEAETVPSVAGGLRLSGRLRPPGR